VLRSAPVDGFRLAYERAGAPDVFADAVRAALARAQQA
jgi:hypothetical protein